MFKSKENNKTENISHAELKKQLKEEYALEDLNTTQLYEKKKETNVRCLKLIKWITKMSDIGTSAIAHMLKR